MKENNFRFRESFGKLVEGMNDRQAGEFIKGVCGFVFGGKPLESKDEYLKGVYLYVRNELETEARNRKNGKIGGAIIAERCKEKRSKLAREEVSVTETNVVSQLIIVSADAQGAAQSDKGKTNNEYGRPRNFNAYGEGKPYGNKNDSKAV